ncbi:ASCH domain-containing protein [Streptococcus danieliae]|uniref:ASCH domain-containing protein n=1 Tax=Streptococcus danieliae TaxID=747656 RepID=A0A7Z0RR36_9STRE|nr:ASCH domain-containing protein [Streptococcus danieliae]MBF0716828.1 ASCH domain-containing protein [Streptococcus danieliae]NYS48758.1 ASCH domain-containing protein [Streptococcus danieliae]
MSPSELWQAYLLINPTAGSQPEAWAFGAEADRLAGLVLAGQKTATSSAYDLYQLAGEDLPKEGGYDILLDGQGQAFAVLATRKVYVCPFDQVMEEHAYQEGEYEPLPGESADLESFKAASLLHWRQVHEDFFTVALMEAGLNFSEKMLVVCEEFELVYRPED